ncbi:MAG: hypothetical protein IJ877_05720 [Candidatus Gastranaerophilales bacterium]|nr:hypothetical protein [Candidatus Gastranaerophilales bacterium]
MAPFPEDEIMTIKRLEVALRKSDFKLLKDGAYKLHEKYHSHHHFEYVDLLQIILEEVETNYAIPMDVKDILIPTIKDILANQNNESENQNRVSSLTSLSYGINSQKEELKEPLYEQKPQIQPDVPKQTKNEEYIKPFQEFTHFQPIETTIEEKKEEPSENAFRFQAGNNDSKSIIDSYNPEPFEDFITEVPVLEQQNIFDNKTEEKSEEFIENIKKEEPVQEYLAQKPVEETIKPIEEPVQEVVQEPIKEFIQEPPKEEIQQKPVQQFFVQEPPKEEIKEEEPIQETVQEPIQQIQSAVQEIIEEPKEEVQEIEQKAIAIFYGQDSSNEKIKNIIKYRELIHNNGNFSLNEITSLINEIKTQADTNVSELKTLLEQLKTTNHNVNLLTNSQSANLVELFNQSNITYSIFNPSEDKRVNLLPLLGLTNLYKCFECDNEFLEDNEKINSFILQCHKCKGAMLPDLYCAKGEINMDYYNSSIIALANSDIWLLIHPSLSERLTLNMIRSALKVSSQVREIYIVDKDINIRETYRKLFYDINPEVKVNTNLNVIEEFFSNI